MATLTVLYWRDIPAQIVVKAGRRSAKRPLSPRFQEAIDAAAMRAGLAGTDDYLSAWRRGSPSDCGDDLEAEADTAADNVETDYPQTRLRTLVQAGGNEQAIT
jgi:hypothetical protein